MTNEFTITTIDYTTITVTAITNTLAYAIASRATLLYDVVLIDDDGREQAQVFAGLTGGDVMTAAIGAWASASNYGRRPTHLTAYWNL